MNLEVFVVDGVKQIVFAKPFFYGDGIEERLGHYLILQRYNYPSVQRMPAIGFFSQWIRQERSDGYFCEVFLCLLKNWAFWGEEFLLCLFNNFHILTAGFRQRILQGPICEELFEKLLVEVERGKAIYCRFDYPSEALAYESMVDGLEFRLLRNSDEYLPVLYTCQGHVNLTAPVLGGDGALHFGIFRGNEVLACLELHSVFEICYSRPGALVTPEMQLDNALVRKAVLRWLKANGLAQIYGPYFPGDYEYVLERDEDNGRQ